MTSRSWQSRNLSSFSLRRGTPSVRRTLALISLYEEAAWGDSCAIEYSHRWILRVARNDGLRCRAGMHLHPSFRKLHRTAAPERSREISPRSCCPLASPAFTVNVIAAFMRTISFDCASSETTKRCGRLALPHLSCNGSIIGSSRQASIRYLACSSLMEGPTSPLNDQLVVCASCAFSAKLPCLLCAVSILPAKPGKLRSSVPFTWSVTLPSSAAAAFEIVSSRPDF